MKALKAMRETAARYNLGSPLSIATKWSRDFNIPSAAEKQRASPLGGATRGGVNRTVAAPPAPSGGFLTRHGSGQGRPDDGARDSGAGGVREGDTNGSMQAKRPRSEDGDTKLAKKKLVELTYEEYIQVFGLVSAKWREWQREAPAAAGIGAGFETEEQYLRKVRKGGDAVTSDAVIRQKYRQLVREAKGARL